MSCGESNTRCRASVSSTTPRLEPRWPPRTETVSTISSRISAASVSRAPASSPRRSAGPRTASRSRGAGEPAGAGEPTGAGDAGVRRRALTGPASSTRWRSRTRPRSPVPTDRRRGPRRMAGYWDQASMTDFDVLEDAQRVRDEGGDRVVGTDEVGDDRLLADAHEPHRQARLVFVRDAHLVQPDDTLIVLTGAHHDDRAGVLVGDRDLVAGEDRHATPGGHLPAVDIGTDRVEAPGIALPAEGRNRLGMREEEVGVPPAGEQLVHVVGRGGAGSAVDTLLQVGVVEESELGVGDRLVLRALP